MRLLTGLVCLLVACAHAPVSEPGPKVVRSIAPADRKVLAALVSQNESETELAARMEVEWKLVQALERTGLNHLAFVYGAPIVKASAHPHHLDAVEALLRLQPLSGDDLLAPSLLNQALSGGAPAGLSAGAVARFAYLRARIAFRRGELDQVLSLTSQVPAASPVFALSQYVRAVVLADPRLTGGPRIREALTTLEALAGLEDTTQEKAEAVRDQTLLALGRLHFGQGHWPEAVRWYERAAQRPAVRARAMFEQSYALMKQREWVRAAALLQRPEVRASGIAEAATAQAMALHYAGDAAGAERVLSTIRPEDTVDWMTIEPARADDACRTGRSISAQTSALLKENHRLWGLYAFIKSLEDERLLVTTTWSGAPATSFEPYLTQNHASLRMAGAQRCLRELQELQFQSRLAVDTATFLGIEVALAGRDLDLAIERAERLLPAMPVKSVPRADLLFRIAALRQARAEAMKGPEAAEERAQVVRLIEEILAGDATFERYGEARGFLDAPSAP